MTVPILVTGGAGFIGSNFILEWMAADRGPVINLDLLTYAGNLGNLASLEGNTAHHFVHGDIGDRPLVDRLLAEHRPWAVVNFAAETHVDRSIAGPHAFLQTNIQGTFELLNAMLAYYRCLEGTARDRYRFVHVSTDEVYGTLGPDDPAFHERTPYAPNSPYAASKASSDHLVRSWVHTYGLPAIITNCSNNYGPRQFPEKLLPLVIHNALAGKPLPIYGDGRQVRDWLYVRDHCHAIMKVLESGRIGESYNIGGNNQFANLDVVHLVCSLLDELVPDSSHKPHANLIRFVTDRPGHDRRYAIDARKITQELGWEPEDTFASGLRATIKWYLDHPEWIEEVTSGAYQRWITANYSDRMVSSGAITGPSGGTA